MKEFLSQHDVSFEEKDVAADREAREEMVNLTGRLAVPALKIGDQAVVGFDQDRIKKLLNL